MGRKKKFIDKKKSATFQLLARDSSDPNYDDSPGSDRVFIRVDNNPFSLAIDNDGSSTDHCKDDPNSVFADAPEDYDGGEDDYRVFGNSAPSQAVTGGPKPLPENVRREILELGFPDDGYNYLIHMREIKNTGGGSAFYHNPKAKLDQLPRDVKAYDASKVHISDVNDDPNEKFIYNVASKSVGVKVQKAVDPEIAALLDDDDLSRFGSDVEDLEEDFVVQANLLKEGDDRPTDKMSSLVHESDTNKIEMQNAGTSGYHTVLEGLGSHDGTRNHTANGGDSTVVENPRVRRLLDEQFDLLVSKEYESDDDGDNGDGEDYDYDGNVAEEDESLAEKLKHALGDHITDDLELDDKYMAPGDLLNDNERPRSKELLESATEVIRRCVEYAEKYENEVQDKDVVIVEESSDESEKWDCDTIVSTYSNLDNHPGKIEAPEVTRRKKKLAETVDGALSFNNHVITLGGKDKLPLDFLPHARKPATQKAKDVGCLTMDQQKRKQHGQESKEEKKERKAAVKVERHEARRIKKDMKDLYKGEAQRAQRVAAVSGPSSIHLM